MRSFSSSSFTFSAAISANACSLRCLNHSRLAASTTRMRGLAGSGQRMCRGGGDGASPANDLDDGYSDEDTASLSTHQLGKVVGGCSRTGGGDAPDGAGSSRGQGGFFGWGWLSAPHLPSRGRKLCPAPAPSEGPRARPSSAPHTARAPRWQARRARSSWGPAGRSAGSAHPGGASHAPETSCPPDDLASRRVILGWHTECFSRTRPCSAGSPSSSPPSS